MEDLKIFDENGKALHITDVISRLTNTNYKTFSKSTEVPNTQKPANCGYTVLANVIYPQLEDIRIACQMIANGIDDSTPMLSKEETVQFQQLATKWMYGLRKHKKEVIDGMISELSL